MKNIIKRILLFTTIVVSLEGCSDFLNQPVLGVNLDTPSYYNIPENANMAVVACYNDLTDDDDLTAFPWIFGDVISDDAKKGGQNETDARTMDDVKYWRALAANDYVNKAWASYYKGVNRSNTVILNLKDATFDENMRKQYVAEAKFIRAYSYFRLVKLFGDIPFYTAPLKIDELGKVPRTPFNEVLLQIEKDLEEAAVDLPQSYSDDQKGRATANAAKSLQARVVMYSIGFFKSKESSAWQQVYDLCTSVINSGYNSLHPNYAQIFEAEGENCSESIFEIQYETSNTGYSADNQGSSSTVYTLNRGTDTNPYWGWGFNAPTKNLVDEFEDGDPRKFCTVYGSGITDYVYGELQEVADPATATHLTGYHVRKLALDPALKPANHSDSPSNLRIIRFSDVILMKAEASYNLGREDEARDNINLVRNRARNSTYPKGFDKGTNTYKDFPNGSLLKDIPSTVTGAELLKAIKHERRVELAMESLRYSDLVRWGDYRATLSSEVQARYDLRQLRGVPVLPIPESEVISWGLTQNPGY